MIDILSYKALKSNISLRLTAPDPISFVGDPVRWSQAILNLVTNGIDAYDGVDQESKKREVSIEFRRAGELIYCTISDYGCGIPTEQLEKVFEPFFTTKPGELTKGTGIGLSMVRKIIEEDFKGTIALTSSPASGTVFTITLSIT